MKQKVWRKMNLSLNMLRILWAMQLDGFNSAFMGMSMNSSVSQILLSIWLYVLGREGGTLKRRE